MKNHSHFKAILLALFVTFLWSTSFVIIKIGLSEIPPLTYAGLRYSIAFICLLPLAFTKANRVEIKILNRSDWIKLFIYGLLFIAFTQGAMFTGLLYLPAVTVSLWLNFTPLVVAVLAIFLIKEYPTIRQWGGVLLFIAGIVIYFLPIVLSENQEIGLIVMTIGVFANSGSSVLGRSINREAKINPVVVTIVSMGIGSLILFIGGVVIQGLPSISMQNILYLLWLAVINTALAFVIWNFTLRTLSAMESSIINGTMLIQIAILAWVFLGEVITLQEGIGMLIAALGVLLVQIKIKNKMKT
ncbi:MAG: DMT family transporter [Ignavibacteria bacterium]|nr:DMT family transporter [Ignavibacteria bacterium]MBT8383535.1 DMT family transporter [Ignavibacteria bacterium]MBT8390498.1 DMT family transporter [Ignavibacteria bacterium]NNJ52568.1 EamA family transporter [Ignavibacteriaceae bacterium]NNL20037.1 EamA family transporter [Ignavibacteriaceae bacterium]